MEPKVNSVQDLRDILDSWKGQKAPKDIAKQLVELEAGLNAYDQDNDPSSFRAQSQARRRAEDAHVPPEMTKYVGMPELKASDWGPAHQSPKGAFLRGASIRRGIGDLVASPLLVTDAAEMALDAVRGAKSPNRFLQASNTIAGLLGEEPEFENRFPSDYDRFELAGGLINPANLLGFGELGDIAKLGKLQRAASSTQPAAQGALSQLRAMTYPATESGQLAVRDALSPHVAPGKYVAGDDAAFRRQMITDEAMSNASYDPTTVFRNPETGEAIGAYQLGKRANGMYIPNLVSYQKGLGHEMLRHAKEAAGDKPVYLYAIPGSESLYRDPRQQAAGWVESIEDGIPMFMNARN